MCKRKGKFEAFRGDIEAVVIGHLAKESTAKEVAKAVRKAKRGEKRPLEPQEPTERPSEVQEHTEQVLVSVEQPLESPETAPTAPPEAPEAPVAAPPAVELEASESEELGESVEVDRWGFQVALGRLREAPEPSEAIAVLLALRNSQPSEQLLTRVAWEVARRIDTQ